MASHTIDSLAQLLERMERDLRDHRDEAAAANQRTTEKLDEIKEELVGTRETEKRVDKLEKTVFGEGDEPGIKGRLDSTQRNVGAIIWLGVSLLGGVVALFFDWVSRSLHGGKP